MTMMAIGSAIAGGMSSIFGGKAQSAAMEQANQQAYQRWIQANTQKTFNNSREQFQAAYQATQQLKRNSAIAKAAWQSDWDAKQALNFKTGFQQKELATQIQSQKSSLLNAILAKGVSASSNAYAAMATAQSLDALKNAAMIKRNAAIELQNINKQTQGMLSQQTQNIFMPNIQLPDAAPIFGDASAAETGGMISGMLQIGAGLAAGATDFMKSSTTSAGLSNAGTEGLADPYGSWSWETPDTISTIPQESNIPYLLERPI